MVRTPPSLEFMQKSSCLNYFAQKINLTSFCIEFVKKYVLQQQNPFRRIIMFDFAEKMQKLKINIDRERFSCYDIIEKREYYVY